LPTGTSSSIIIFCQNSVLKFYFAGRHYFSPLNTFMRTDKWNGSGSGRPKNMRIPIRFWAEGKRRQDYLQAYLNMGTYRTIHK
jgi:hypothetical protein